MNGVNGFAAGATFTSWWWLPALHNVSDLAGNLAPILAVVWLGVQIAAKVIEIKRQKKLTVKWQ